MYREHFIYAKYERKEFTRPDASLYECGVKEGTLYKRGKKDKSFRPRTFVLDTEQGVLKYFVKEDVRNFILLNLLKNSINLVNCYTTSLDCIMKVI